MEFNDTIIGSNTNISGDLKCLSNLIISGQTDGSIFAEKNITTREKGVIKGNAECVEFNLYGTLEGKVKAKKVYLASSGKLLGDLTAQLLQVEEGAHFIGCSKKISEDKESKLKNTDPVYEI